MAELLLRLPVDERLRRGRRRNGCGLFVLELNLMGIGITLQVFRNQSIYVIFGFRRWSFPNWAWLIVMATLAGRLVVSAKDLAGLNASVYRFHLERIRRGQGDWPVCRMAWERADLADFW